jgi:hypothetical protein
MAIMENEDHILNSIVMKISEIIFNCNRFDLPGPISQNGPVGFSGVMDIGSARDLNRHRSAKRFFPYLSDAYPTLKDLEDESVSSKFTLCPYLYLRELKFLKLDYDQFLHEHYLNIQRLIEFGKVLKIDKKILNEFTKYLLPMGHLVNYSFYTDYKNLMYIADLRTAPGGHIAYREIVYKWIEVLAEDSEFFKPLLLNLQSVDRFSIPEYFDRS